MYDFGRALSPEEKAAEALTRTAMYERTSNVAIMRELREQRKMLEQLLEIKAQNQSISPE